MTKTRAMPLSAESLESRRMLAIADGYYSIQSLETGKYLEAIPGFDFASVTNPRGFVRASATTPRESATFYVETQSDGRQYLRTNQQTRITLYGGPPLNTYVYGAGAIPNQKTDIVWSSTSLASAGFQKIRVIEQLNNQVYLCGAELGDRLMHNFQAPDKPDDLAFASTSTAMLGNFSFLKNTNFTLRPSAYAPSGNLATFTLPPSPPPSIGQTVQPQPVAIPSGSLAIPIPVSVLYENSAPVQGESSFVVVSGGGTLNQSGAINVGALAIGTMVSAFGLTEQELPNTLLLTGSAVVNAPSGVTVDGQLGMSAGTSTTAATPVFVNPKGLLRGSGGILGSLTVAATGEISPAGSADGTPSHGRMNVGRLALASGSVLRMQVAGPRAGTDHDQLVVADSLAIDGARLALDATYAPPQGSSIVLVDNRGTAPISGTFRDASGNPLPEGATVVANVGGTGRPGRISYRGGDGNDVALVVYNVAPVAVALAKSRVPENRPAGTIVGNLSTTDANAGDTFTYTLVPDPKLDGTGLFEVVGDELRTKAPLDFEAKSSYSVRVRTTDQDGLSVGKVLTVTVRDVNEAPTAMALSAANVAENRPAGTVVGTLSTTDPDAANTFRYAIVADPTLDGTNLFEIVGNELRTKAPLNFEAKSRYSVRVRSTDQGGLFTGRVLTISVTDVNEAPTALSLLPATVLEGRPVGTVVGTFASTDPDAANTFRYTIVPDATLDGTAHFEIVGNQLRTKTVFNAATKSTYSLRVRTTDQGGLSRGQVFTITVGGLA